MAKMKSKYRTILAGLLLGMLVWGTTTVFVVAGFLRIAVLGISPEFIGTIPGRNLHELLELFVDGSLYAIPMLVISDHGVPASALARAAIGCAVRTVPHLAFETIRPEGYLQTILLVQLAMTGLLAGFCGDGLVDRPVRCRLSITIPLAILASLVLGGLTAST